MVKNKTQIIFFTKLLGIFFIFLLLTTTASASELSSSSFIIKDPVIGTIGGYGASAIFKLISSGETAFTDINSSSSFLGHYGFLYFTTPETETPSGGGGGGGGTINPRPPIFPFPPILPDGECRIADFNCDGDVNIEDLSILLYHIFNTDGDISYFDLSEDGILDIRDISIMFYYWDI